MRSALIVGACRVVSIVLVSSLTPCKDLHAFPGQGEESATGLSKSSPSPLIMMAWADYDRDGYVDVYLYCNEATMVDRLLRNRGDRVFEDVSAVTGLNDQCASRIARWVDYDGNGTMDLFLVNREAHACLLRNPSLEGFVNVTSDVGLDLATEILDAEWLDYDRDGLLDLDLVTAHGDQLFHAVCEQGAIRFVELKFSSPIASHATPVSSTRQSDTHALVAASCEDLLKDQGVAGGCLAASSVPTLGLLYPITVNRWVDSNGNVGIGTTSPAARLDVAGPVRISDGTQAAGRILTSTSSGDASWQVDASAFPGGALMYFDLSTCPPGWSELVAARGRYVVGLPLGGISGSTTGTALADVEDRATGQHTHAATATPHTHGVNDSHAHSYDAPATAQSVIPGSGPTVYTSTQSALTGGSSGTLSVNSAFVNGVSIQSAGTVQGTNAPYIQLRLCRKN